MTFWVTFFDNVFANTLRGEDMTLDELGELIANTAGSAKDQLPILKLARFGTARTPANCLRHDGNVLTVSGLEVDYDGEEMPFAEAVDRLEAAGLAFLAYTSPSHCVVNPPHSRGGPRWRGLLPFSRDLPAAERARLTNWVNGVLGGVLARESWGISQAFYYGHIDGAAFEMHVGSAEQCVDEADLEAIAQPYRPASGTKGTATPDFDAMDEAELLDVIQSGAHYWGPAKRLLAMWARQGVKEADAESNLTAAFDAVPQIGRGKKWIKNRKSIARWIKQVYARVAKHKGKFFSALVDYIENTSHWKGAVRINRFTQTVEVCNPFPPQPGQTIGSWRAVREHADLLETLILVQGDGFPTARKGVVLDALILAAERHAYHPVRDWLDSLVWDGKERINRLFRDYFPGEMPEEEQGADATDNIVSYYEKTAECFLVGAVARIYAPGCKLDTAPVLIAPQGHGKSRGILALVPDPAWFSDDLSPYLIDRDTKDSLNGKWIIELAEIPHVRKDAEKVKAFFSRQTDRFRRAYDRLTNDWPRQCAFIGSSNDLEFADVTGNRRFWPIPLSGRVNVADIERDREQLWAEAVHWYRSEYPWWLMPEVEAIAGEMQSAYADGDIWDEPLATWIDTRFPPDKATGARKIEPFTVSDVLEGFGYVLKPKDRPDLGDKPVAGKGEEMRVARCLKRLGYRRDPHRHRRAGRQVCFWVPA